MKLRELKIIHAALMGGVLVYAGLATFLVVTGFDGFGGAPPIPIEYAGAVMLLLMAGGAVARRRLVAQVSLDDPPEVRLPAYANAVIIGAALPEGGGLLLITLGLMSASASWIIAGGLAAAFLIWQGRPRAEEVGLE